MRDTFSSLVVHCGAAQFISETRRIAARRCSVLEAELVYLEGKFAEARAAGGEPDPATLDLYGRLADRQRRLSEPLGWDRTAPDVDDLYTHIERRDAQKANGASRCRLTVKTAPARLWTRLQRPHSSPGRLHDETHKSPSPPADCTDARSVPPR